MARRTTCSSMFSLQVPKVYIAIPPAARGYTRDIILKLYRRLHTAVQSSPRIRNLTGQFSWSTFGLKEARIRPNLCRHKMPTWLGLKSNLYADVWRVVKYEKPTKFESVKQMSNLWPTCFSILLFSWIASFSQSAKYRYKVCTETQLTVLKRCMAMQAAFVMKVVLLFLPCGYNLFYHLWCFFQD